jgi:hypothetical protein
MQRLIYTDTVVTGMMTSVLSIATVKSSSEGMNLMLTLYVATVKASSDG